MYRSFLFLLPALLFKSTHAGPAPPIKVEFEFYPDRACSSGTLSAKMLDPTRGCVDLETPGLSFHVGGPATQQRVPKGYTVVGYTEKCCRGEKILEVVGLSDAGTCYKTIGDTGEVLSLRMEAAKEG